MEAAGFVAAEPPKPERVVASVVDIGLPIANVGRVPCARLDTRLTPRQQTALRRLYDGLQADDALVHVGVTGNDTTMSPVRTQGDAIRWVLDQVADALDIKPADCLKAI